MTPFDQANDPPLLPFLDDDNGSVRSFSTKSTHDSFFQLTASPVAHDNAIALERRFISSAEEGPMNAIGLFHPHWPKQLEIVKVPSSDNEASAKSAGIPQDGAKESDSAASRKNSSEFHHQLFSDKPENFSIHGSPIRKAESTQTSLVVDCSFDANLRSIDGDKSAVQDSVESKWVTFDQPFAPAALERKRSGSAELSFSSQNPEAGDPDIEELHIRLTSLERIVHGLSDHATNRVSDSLHSDQSPSAQTQDMAFIIEGTEILELGKGNKEDSKNLAVLGGKKSNGRHFPVRFFSKIFGKKSGWKTSRAEM